MAETKTPAAEPLVSIYNRSRRSYIHDKYTIAGSTFTEVPQKVAEYLLKTFPTDLVERGVANRELNGVQIDLAETRQKLADAEARIKELEAAAAKAATPAKKTAAPAASADV